MLLGKPTVLASIKGVGFDMAIVGSQKEYLDCYATEKTVGFCLIA